MNENNHKSHGNVGMQKVDFLTDLEIKWQKVRMLSNHEELLERIVRAVPNDGDTLVLEGLLLVRASSPLGLMRGLLKPSFCVIAQGSKEVLLGDSHYFYDSDH